jgi:hypothetical protein
MLLGIAPGEFHHSIYRGLEERLYLLTYGDQVLAIEIGPLGNVPHDFPRPAEYLDQVTPIVDILRFEV